MFYDNDNNYCVLAISCVYSCRRMFLTFFCFTFLFFLLVGARKSYFVALVLLSLHFAVNKVYRMLAINVSIPNLKIARFVQF